MQNRFLCFGFLKTFFLVTIQYFSLHRFSLIPCYFCTNIREYSRYSVCRRRDVALRPPSLTSWEQSFPPGSASFRQTLWLIFRRLYLKVFLVFFSMLGGPNECKERLIFRVLFSLTLMKMALLAPRCRMAYNMECPCIAFSPADPKILSWGH